MVLVWGFSKGSARPSDERSWWAAYSPRCAVRVSIALRDAGVLSPAILVLLVTAVATISGTAKEGQFFIISGDAPCHGEDSGAPSAVEIQDVAKDVWVTVKKILLSLRMVEKSLWTTQQSIWVTFQGVLPCLENECHSRSAQWEHLESFFPASGSWHGPWGHRHPLRWPLPLQRAATLLPPPPWFFSNGGRKGTKSLQWVPNVATVTHFRPRQRKHYWDTWCRGISLIQGRAPDGSHSSQKGKFLKDAIFFGVTGRGEIQCPNNHAQQNLTKPLSSSWTGPALAQISTQVTLS